MIKIPPVPPASPLPPPGGGHGIRGDGIPRPQSEDEVTISREVEVQEVLLHAEAQLSDFLILYQRFVDQRGQSQ